MTLRTKLLFAQLPLAFALALTSYFSVRTSQGLGLNSKNILKDNFKSVLAAQRIKDAADGLDGLAVGLLVGVAPSDSAAAGLQGRIEIELRVQEGNITEAGERESTAKLRRAWTDYRASWKRLVQSQAPLRPELYGTELREPLKALRDAADEVLALNLDAMVIKNERVQKTVTEYDTLLILATMAACVAGLVASATLTSRLLRPLGVLTQAVRRLGAGDLGVRVNLPGKDEIAELAAEFNTMTDRLEAYRRSSLGELLEIQESSQAALDSLPDPVLAFDAKADLMNVNLAAEKLLGVTVETGLETLGDGSAVKEAILRGRTHVLSGKGAYAPKSFDEAFRTVTLEGERYFLTRATPVHAEAALRGVTVLLQDVTRTRLFDELTHDLVATVAHEFRTPLTSLRMAVHLCLEQVAGPITEKQADLLHAAREDCEHLQAMVDDLLNVAQIQQGQTRFQRTAIALQPFLASVGGAYEREAENRGIELLVEPAPDGSRIDGDSTRLELAFGNLLSNALRYTPKGGRIEWRVKPREQWVRFEVSDTGPGIPPEFHERIFDKFFQLPGGPKGGAGLGLHIAREIVRAHGGDMGIDARKGAGTTFWVDLPLAAPPAAEKA